jgi:hypothetical protein
VNSGSLEISSEGGSGELKNLYMGFRLARLFFHGLKCRDCQGSGARGERTQVDEVELVDEVDLVDQLDGTGGAE